MTFKYRKGLKTDLIIIYEQFVFGIKAIYVALKY
jgi:hypothetical protein